MSRKSLKVKTYDDINAEATVIVDSMNRSDNGKPAVYRDYEAIVTILFTIWNLPIGQLPYTPTEGFDLRSLLYRSETSTKFSEYEHELSEKIANATNKADVNIQLSKDYANNALDVLITYMDNDGKLIEMPFKLEEDSNRQLQMRYKNVLVKP